MLPDIGTLILFASWALACPGSGWPARHKQEPRGPSARL